MVRAISGNDEITWLYRFADIDTRIAIEHTENDLLAIPREDPAYETTYQRYQCLKRWQSFAEG